MAFLNLSRIVTLHQPLIGIGTGKMHRGAWAHTKDMAKSGRFSHYDFNRRSDQYNFRAENIIMGCRSALGCYLIWFGSKGHRQNMFSWGYVFTGIAFCKAIKIRTINKDGNVVKKRTRLDTYGTQVFR